MHAVCVGGGGEGGGGYVCVVAMPHHDRYGMYCAKCSVPIPSHTHTNDNIHIHNTVANF